MIENKLKNKKKQEKLFLVTQKSIPSVLLDVLHTKDLIEKENISIANAVKKIGISRTTYYKYCDEVFYFDSAPRSKEIMLEIITEDKLGMLATITNTISKNNFNILTINQFPPIDNYNKINISIVTTNSKCNLNKLIEDLKKNKNTKEIKIKSIDKNKGNIL